MTVGGHMLKVIESVLKDDRGFSRHLKKIKVLTCENGRCTGEFTVEESMQNGFGTLHGAFTSLVTDNFTTYALLSHPKAISPGVSLDLTTSYFKAAPVGTEIIFDANTIRTGRKVAFLELYLKNKATGELIAKGSHTKYVGE